MSDCTLTVPFGKHISKEQREQIIDAIKEFLADNGMLGIDSGQLYETEDGGFEWEIPVRCSDKGISPDQFLQDLMRHLEMLGYELGSIILRVPNDDGPDECYKIDGHLQVTNEPCES